MAQHMVILNPWAGKGAAGARRAALEAALHNAQIDYTLCTTQARGGAHALACQAVAHGTTQIIAVGGDGTINEVVNGIKAAEAQTGRRATLGIVPIGTGSDFVKALGGGAHADIPAAVGRIAAGRTRRIDLGHAAVAGYAPRFFINGLGMGLDAQIAAEALQITRLHGAAVYLLAIIRALAAYKAHPMTVQHDGSTITRRLLFATVANGICQGGGFYLTPDAVLDDGLLDVCLVDKLRIDEIIRYVPKALAGRHTQLKQVTMRRISTLLVEASAPFPVATDGELIATDARSVTVHVVPAALDLLV